MSKYVVRSLFAFALLALGILLIYSPSRPVQAQRPVPPNDPARGLVYSSLLPDATGKCAGGLTFTVTVKGKTRTYCTHGPDAAPSNLKVGGRVPAMRAGRSLTAQNVSSVVCDGDGVSGNRVQVLYAHASDVADQYAAYLPTFQQWASDMDDVFNKSAALTGGTRHVRFVTDSNCVPVIPDVTLSTTGDDNISNTVSELQAQGFNFTNRKYIIFEDAHVYCGISSTAYDDQPGWQNANNFGDTFGRIDAGCWSPLVAAHELEHQFGAVQMSAPHTDGNWHCTDGYDNMCDYGASPNLNLTTCPDPAYNGLLDCNADDYFNTNPAPGSYLANNWNTANSPYLISTNGVPQPTPVPPTATPLPPTQTPVPPTSTPVTPTNTPVPPTATPVLQTARVDSMVSGKLKGQKFTPTNLFGAGDTVVLRVHVVNQNGSNIGGITVNLPVFQPTGLVQCNLSVTTDSTGTAQGSCQVPRRGPPGKWKGTITKFGKTGFTSDTTNSILIDTFMVQ